MKLLIAIMLGVAACASQLQTIQIVNRTDRSIDELYVYPSGSPDRGKSRATLAPNASTQVQIKAGAVEVYAVSAKIQVDEHTRDRPSASSTVELRGPTTVMFYDAGEKPAEVNRPGVIGVAFTRPQSPPDPGN